MMTLFKALQSWPLRIAALCLLFPLGAQAAPIGMPKDAGRIGVGLAASYLSPEDSAGEVAGEIAWPLLLVNSDRVSLGLRYWAEAFHHSTKIDAEGTSIGMRVEQSGLRFSLQKEIFLEPGVVTPWFGGGLEWSQYKQLDRHTIDADGFLNQRFADVSDSGLALLLNMGREWEVARDLALGVKFEHAIALGDGPDATSFGVILLYDF